MGCIRCLQVSYRCLNAHGLDGKVNLAEKEREPSNRGNRRSSEEAPLKPLERKRQQQGKRHKALPEWARQVLGLLRR